MWKILSTVYPQEFGQIEGHYSFKPTSKALPTGDYFKLLTSDSSRWLTVLDLSTSFVDSLPDLVGIVEITNLVALKITSPPKAAKNLDASTVTLTDRIMRTWSELAHENQAFRQLTILAVSHQPELTEQIFTYLGSFEALGLFLVQACPRFAQKNTRELAKAHGWEVCIKNSSDESLYTYVKRLLDEKAQENRDNPTEIALRPILEFSPSSAKREKTTENYTIVFKRKRRVPALQKRPDQKRETTKNRAAIRVSKPERKPVLKANKKKDMRALLGQFSR